jgi:N-acetylneuraminic acid mutarotase
LLGYSNEAIPSFDRRFDVENLMRKLLPFLLCLLAGGALTSSTRSILLWKQGKELFLPKGGYGSGILDGKLILAGGTHWKDDKKLWLDEVVAYDPQADKWGTLTPLPKPLAYGASVAHEGAFYFVGGAGPEHAERAGYRLRRQDGKYQWEQFTTLPMDRCYSKAAILKNELFLVAGGDSVADLSTASSILLSASLSEQKPVWKTRSPIPGEGRAVFAAATCNGKLYVFGGCNADADGVRNLASAYRYDPALDRWSRLKDTPAPVRAWSASSPDKRFIFLFAGFSSPTPSDPTIPKDGQFEKRVYRYDTVNDDYQEVAPLPYANADISFHFFKGVAYGAGGEPKGKARSPWTFIGEF